MSNGFHLIKLIFFTPHHDLTNYVISILNYIIKIKLFFFYNFTKKLRVLIYNILEDIFEYNNLTAF